MCAIVLYFIHLSFSQWWKRFLVWVVVFRCHKGRKWKIWQPRVAVRPQEGVNVHFQPECGRKTATSNKNCFCHWENDKCNGVHYFFWFCRIYSITLNNLVPLTRFQLMQFPLIGFPLTQKIFQKEYLGCGYKDLVFCRNKGWIIENMDMVLRGCPSGIGTMSICP